MGCGVSKSNEAKYGAGSQASGPAGTGKKSGAPAKKGVAASTLAEALDTFDESAQQTASTVSPNRTAPPTESVNPETAEKLNIVKEVYIFRHLSHYQLKLLVDSFRLSKYLKEAKVISQHAIGDSFFVVASGELEVFIDGKHVRNLGKHAYFGERALLFDEPRTATVQVCSEMVEAWAVDKGTFKEIVQGQMAQQLMYRIRLQDTSVTLEDLKVIRRIGAGAAGEVDLVEHRQTHTRYALKKVKMEDGKVPTEVQRELDLLKMNDHPFVLQLVKTFEMKTEDLVYMLVELITGGELHAAIRTIPTVLATWQAQFYVGSLALALEALHTRRIIYRDLKPENVMLDNQGYLKIIDFGIAKKLEADKNRTYTMVGTPHYMAPEVMKGRGYGTLVDNWALGIMLYEFVCGYLPFANEHDNPEEVFVAVVQGRLEFPAWFKDERGRDLMQWLLCHDPKKRIGAGPSGFEELKNHGWFLTKRPSGNQAHLFDQLMGRELEAPVVPEGEVYGVDQEEH